MNKTIDLNKKTILTYKNMYSVDMGGKYLTSCWAILREWACKRLVTGGLQGKKKTVRLDVGGYVPLAHHL
jgi:hypothetical protein